MKPDDVKDRLGDLPHMSVQHGHKLGQFLQEHRLHDCLELGFFHGTSSAYIAAALDEMGQGSLTCIDLEYVRGLEPNIHQVLQRVGLEDRVTCHFEPYSYLWRLMLMLEEDPTPRFDFCYLDGAHTWCDDGFAFMLVARLLRPGGWIVFDDLNWTFSEMLANVSLDELRKQLPEDVIQFMLRMPEEVRQTEQIRKIYELLVKSHPEFDEFREEMGWAFARKSPDAAGQAALVRREVVTVRVPSRGLGQRLSNWARGKLVR